MEPGSTCGGRTGVVGGGGVGAVGGLDSGGPGGLTREEGGATGDDSEAMQACSLSMRAVSAAERRDAAETTEERPQARSSVVIQNPLTAPEGEDDGWSEQIAETGHVYYYNALTGETQWEPPPRFAT